MKFVYSKPLIFMVDCCGEKTTKHFDQLAHTMTKIH